MKQSWLNYLSLLLKWVWRLIEWIWFLSSSFSPSPLKSSCLFHPYQPASNNKFTSFFFFFPSRKTEDRYLWRLCFKCDIIWSAEHQYIYIFFLWKKLMVLLIFCTLICILLSDYTSKFRNDKVLSWKVSYRGFAKAWLWWRYTFPYLDFGVYISVELCIQIAFFHYLRYSEDIFHFWG